MLQNRPVYVVWPHPLVWQQDYSTQNREMHSLLCSDTFESDVCCECSTRSPNGAPVLLCALSQLAVLLTDSAIKPSLAPRLKAPAAAGNNGAIQYSEPLEERGHLNENNEVIL